MARSGFTDSLHAVPSVGLVNGGSDRLDTPGSRPSAVDDDAQHLRSVEEQTQPRSAHDAPVGTGAADVGAHPPKVSSTRAVRGGRAGGVTVLHVSANRHGSSRAARPAHAPGSGVPASPRMGWRRYAIEDDSEGPAERAARSRGAGQRGTRVDSAAQDKARDAAMAAIAASWRSPRGNPGTAGERGPAAVATTSWGLEPAAGPTARPRTASSRRAAPEWLRAAAQPPHARIAGRGAHRRVRSRPESAPNRGPVGSRGRPSSAPGGRRVVHATVPYRVRVAGVVRGAVAETSPPVAEPEHPVGKAAGGDERRRSERERERLASKKDAYVRAVMAVDADAEAALREGDIGSGDHDGSSDASDSSDTVSLIAELLEDEDPRGVGYGWSPQLRRSKPPPPSKLPQRLHKRPPASPPRGATQRFQHSKFPTALPTSRAEAVYLSGVAEELLSAAQPTECRGIGDRSVEQFVAAERRRVAAWRATLREMCRQSFSAVEERGMLLERASVALLDMLHDAHAALQAEADKLDEAEQRIAAVRVICWRRIKRAERRAAEREAALARERDTLLNLWQAQKRLRATDRDVAAREAALQASRRVEAATQCEPPPAVAEAGTQLSLPRMRLGRFDVTPVTHPGGAMRGDGVNDDTLRLDRLDMVLPLACTDPELLQTVSGRRRVTTAAAAAEPGDSSSDGDDGKGGDGDGDDDSSSSTASVHSAGSDDLRGRTPRGFMSPASATSATSDDGGGDSDAGQSQARVRRYAAVSTPPASRARAAKAKSATVPNEWTSVIGPASRIAKTRPMSLRRTVALCGALLSAKFCADTVAVAHGHDSETTATFVISRYWQEFGSRSLVRGRLTTLASSLRKWRGAHCCVRLLARMVGVPPSSLLPPFAASAVTTALSYSLGTRLVGPGAPSSVPMRQAAGAARRVEELVGTAVRLPGAETAASRSAGDAAAAAVDYLEALPEAVDEMTAFERDPHSAANLTLSKLYARGGHRAHTPAHAHTHASPRSSQRRSSVASVSSVLGAAPVMQSPGLGGLDEETVIELLNLAALEDPLPSSDSVGVVCGMGLGVGTSSAATSHYIAGGDTAGACVAAIIAGCRIAASSRQIDLSERECCRAAGRVAAKLFAQLARLDAALARDVAVVGEAVGGGVAERAARVHPDGEARRDPHKAAARLVHVTVAAAVAAACVVRHYATEAARVASAATRINRVAKRALVAMRTRRQVARQAHLSRVAVPIDGIVNAVLRAADSAVAQLARGVVHRWVARGVVGDAAQSALTWRQFVAAFRTPGVLFGGREAGSSAHLSGARIGDALLLSVFTEAAGDGDGVSVAAAATAVVRRWKELEVAATPKHGKDGAAALHARIAGVARVQAAWRARKFRRALAGGRTRSRRAIDTRPHESSEESAAAGGTAPLATPGAAPGPGSSNPAGAVDVSVHLNTPVPSPTQVLRRADSTPPRPRRASNVTPAARRRSYVGGRRRGSTSTPAGAGGSATRRRSRSRSRSRSGSVAADAAAAAAAAQLNTHAP